MTEPAERTDEGDVVEGDPVDDDLDDGRLCARVAPELIRFATALAGRVDAPDVLSSAVVKALAAPGWPAVRNRPAYL